MTTRREWLVAGAAFLFGLLVVAILAALLFVPRGGGSAQRARLPGGLIQQTATRIENRMRAERSVVRPVRGRLHFLIADVAWIDPGRPAFVKVPELQGELDTRAAGHGDIVIRGLAINGGEVFVQQDARGDWNYQRVMAPLFEPGEPNAPQRAFVVTDIAIRNVHVAVKMPQRSFEFRNLAAQVPRAEFSGARLPAPRVEVARATAQLAVSDSLYPVSAENAQLTFPTNRVDFTVARVTSGDTRLASLAGTFGGNLPGYGLRLTGQAENLRFQDVSFLSKRLPRSGTASFGFSVEPISNRLTQFSLSNARLDSQGSRVTGSGSIQFGDSAFAVQSLDVRFDPVDVALLEQLTGDTLPYRGSIVGTARGTDGLITFDVASRLTTAQVRQPFTTRLSGTARLSTAGFQLRHVEVNLRDTPLLALKALIPGLPLKGVVNGRVVVDGPPGKTPLDLNLRVELAGGVAIVDGQLDLSGAVPTYNVTGRLLAVNLQQLLAPAAPPVLLTAHFSAIGSGLNPDVADARLHLEGHFTGWQTSPHDTVHVAARVQSGTLHVDSAALKLASMNASAKGEWRFAAPSSGFVEYHVAIDPITPFGPYIPAIGNDEASGSIAAAGRVTGGRGSLQINGTADGSALTIGSWAAAAIAGKYSVALGQPVPQFDVQMNARDLRTPTAGVYQTAVVAVKLQSPVFSLNAHANRPGSPNGLEIVADGRIPAQGAREIVLQRARIDLGSNNWALAAPATFSWAAPGADLDVRGFEMRKSDGNGIVKLDGRVLPLTNADFTLATAELPVGDLQRLLGKPVRVAGSLWTNTSMRVVAGVPQLNMKFRLDSAVVEDVRFAQLTGDASYVGQTLTANANAIVDSTRGLQLHAELPVDLHFAPTASVQMLSDGPVHVTLVSDSVALAPFAALSANVQKLSGTLAANVTVTGTVKDPVLNGILAVRNGAMNIVPLNQHFDSVNASIELDQRTARIADFSAKAGGHLHTTGTIEFRDLTKPVLDVTATLDRFEPVGVDNQADAQITGRAHLGGPLREAVLTGDLTLADGYFPVPQVGSPSLDADLAQFEPQTTSNPAVPTPSIFSGVSITGLRINVGPNLWFDMPDARAELAGSLTIDKNGDNLRIVGDLEGERGTYVLRAGPIIRRFSVTHALVRFLGGSDVNPAIDITAQRTVVLSSGRDINVDVHVGGTMQSPSLSLASQDAATIPQSELLSFLLFGQPSFALGGSGSLVPGQQVIEQTVVGGLTELASIELEQSLLDQLGLSFDIFQIRLGGARLNDLAPSLVVGREVATNVFLTVETAVNTLFGGTESTAATFAVHLEWRVNPNTTLRTSYEPANKNSVLRGYMVALPAALRPAQPYQGTVEFRRRWTW